MKAIIADTCYSEIITFSYFVVNHNGYSFILFLIRMALANIHHFFRIFR